MALTPEQVASLTLADIEAIASRFDGAVRTIRDAQALLGGAPVASGAAPQPIRAAHHLTPQEIAEAKALKAQFASSAGEQ